MRLCRAIFDWPVIPRNVNPSMNEFWEGKNVQSGLNLFLLTSKRSLRGDEPAAMRWDGRYFRVRFRQSVTQRQHCIVQKMVKRGKDGTK